MKPPSAWRGASSRTTAAKLFNAVMWPSNAVCDAFDMEDEHERGMVRMLVNTLLWTTIGATGFFVAWMLFSGF